MKLLSTLAPLCALSLAAVSCNAQFYKLHNVDLAGSAIGQFTTPLTTNNAAIVQTTTDTMGAEFTLREHPVSWAGIELNYAWFGYNNNYAFQGNGITTASYTAKVRTNAHEATAAYLFHGHYRSLQPFLAIGGGAIDFLPQPTGRQQWRGVGLLEAGIDVPTSNPHFGFRIQGRSLTYRAPNFQQANLASRSWVTTSEPSAGVWYRF